MDQLLKDAEVFNLDTTRIGSRIMLRGKYATVLCVNYYCPGEHPESPIGNDWYAVEAVTERGSRWRGIRRQK